MIIFDNPSNNKQSPKSLIVIQNGGHLFAASFPAKPAFPLQTVIRGKKKSEKGVDNGPKFPCISYWTNKTDIHNSYICQIPLSETLSG